MIESVMLWNEPNNLSHWDFELDPGLGRSSPTMVRLAADAVRAENPTLTRVLGGISPIDPGFITQHAAQGVLDHVDVVAVHGFPLDWNHWTIRRVARQAAPRSARSPTMPLWVSEVGVSTFGAEEVQEFGLRRTRRTAARAGRPRSTGTASTTCRARGRRRRGTARRKGRRTTATSTWACCARTARPSARCAHFPDSRPALGICQWFHFEDPRLDDAVQLAQANSASGSFAPASAGPTSCAPTRERWFDRLMHALEPFDVTVTFCFTPEACGASAAPHEPASRPSASSPTSARRMTRRYARVVGSVVTSATRYLTRRVTRAVIATQESTTRARAGAAIERAACKRFVLFATSTLSLVGFRATQVALAVELTLLRPMATWTTTHSHHRRRGFHRLASRRRTAQSQAISVRALDNLVSQVHGDTHARPAYLDPGRRAAWSATFAIADVCRSRPRRASTRSYHFAAQVGVGQSMYRVGDYTSVNNVGHGGAAGSPDRAAGRAADRRLEHEHLRRRLYRDADGSARAARRAHARAASARRLGIRDAEGEPLHAVPTPGDEDAVAQVGLRAVEVRSGAAVPDDRRGLQASRRSRCASSMCTARARRSRIPTPACSRSSPRAC